MFKNYGTEKLVIESNDTVQTSYDEYRRESIYRVGTYPSNLIVATSDVLTILTEGNEDLNTNKP